MKTAPLLCVALVLAGCITVNVPVSVAKETEEPADAVATASKVLYLMASEPDAVEPEPSGFLLGSPTGLTSALHPAIRVRHAGFDEGWTAGLAAEFEDFTTEHFSSFGTTEPPILAMSLGIDVIVVEEERFEIGEELDGASLSNPLDVAVALTSVHGWMAFQFSVDYYDETFEDETGLPLADDVVWAQGEGELERTVFSYLVPDSDAEMLPYEWQSVRAMDPVALGLDPGDEIHALNMHMALYGTNLGAYPPFFTRPLPALPTVYFTL